MRFPHASSRARIAEAILQAIAASKSLPRTRDGRLGVMIGRTITGRMFAMITKYQVAGVETMPELLVIVQMMFATIQSDYVREYGVYCRHRQTA